MSIQPTAIPLDAEVIWSDLAGSHQWHTVATLAKRWGTTYAPFELEDALEHLAKAGHVTCLAEGAELKFCVTSDCMPFPGYHLDGRPIHQEDTHA